MTTVLQKKTLLLEKEVDNLKVWSLNNLESQITIQWSNNNCAQKKCNPYESKIGLERVVTSKFDKGLEKVILSYIFILLFSGTFKNIPSFYEHELQDLIEKLVLKNMEHAEYWFK